MEIEKIIRIIAVFFVVAAFAVKVATYLMFPEAPRTADIPVMLVLAVSVASIWRNTSKNTNANK